MPTPVEIVVERSFRVPPAKAYEWLTDIDDADVERTDAVLESRKVLERAPDRVVYEGETEVLGRRIFGRTEVALRPPDRWEARTVSGPRKGSFTRYHVAPEEGGSRVRVHYHFILDDPTRHVLLRVAKPLVRRELRKMWDGFAAAMEKELAP